MTKNLAYERHMETFMEITISNANTDTKAFITQTGKSTGVVSEGTAEQS